MQAHEGFKKACMIAGITHMRVLQTHPQHDFALQVGLLWAPMVSLLAMQGLS